MTLAADPPQPFIPWQATRLSARRVLVLAAHPDDEVFGCGASLYLHQQEGAEVCVIILTDGAYGAEQGEAQNAVMQERLAESRAAAQVLGLDEQAIECWQLPDGQLEYTEPLVERLRVCIHEGSFDLIYAPSLMELHPDHCALAISTAEAVRRIGSSQVGLRLAFYEVSAPLRPNTLVDITALVTRKRQAMECFGSQNVRQRYAQQIAALNTYRSYTLGLEVQAAEAFEVVDAAALQANHLALLDSDYTYRRLRGHGTCIAQDMPLVSIIVRSMDRSTLARTLASVHTQTYSHIEVLVVAANGSVHRPLHELPGQSSERIQMHLIASAQALGRSQAANAGLAAAKGRFLMFLDDDDTILPHHVAALVATLQASLQENAIAAYADISAVDAQGQQVRLFSEAFDPIRLLIENYLPIHAVLFRRTAYEAGARFDEALPVCEDWDFWQSVAAYGHFLHVPQVGGHYHLQAGEQSSGVWQQGQQEAVRQAMLSVYQKRLPDYSSDQIWAVFDAARQQRLCEQQAAKDASQAALQIAQLQEQLSTAQSQTQQLLASSSWRITAPLWALRQFFSSSFKT